MFSKIRNVHRVHRWDEVRNNFLSVRTPLKNPTWRPQPREVKAVSQSEQSMMTRVTFRMNLIQPSKGIERKLFKRTLVRKLGCKKKPSSTTRKTWYGGTTRQTDDARATAWPSSLFGGNEKCPHALKWQDIKDKMRNMAISDDRKWSDVSGRITKKLYRVWEQFKQSQIISKLTWL